jgi:hypothetical protein
MPEAAGNSLTPFLQTARQLGIVQYDDRRLVRHPNPVSCRESLRGYILRLAECNGYPSPWAIFTRAGMKQYEARGTAFNLEKLAQVSNRRIVELQEIAYSTPGRERSYQILGWDLPPTEFNFGSPRICPHCVSGIGIIEAIWDLDLMVGCPVHGYYALTNCPQCKCAVEWYRPGLIVCACGAELTNEEGLVLDPGPWALLEIVRNRTLRLLQFPDNIGFPPELYHLDLRTLLSLIRTVGSCKSGISVESVRGSSQIQIVSCAARVFSHWPENFFALLADLQRRPAPSPYDVRQHFAPLYNALLKEKSLGQRPALRFLQVAFLDFISNHQSIRAGDPRLLNHLEAPPNARFVTRAAFAQALHVNPRTVTRLMGPKPVQGRRAPFSFVIDSAGFAKPEAISGRVLPLRQAAALLSCPVSVFEAFTRTGLFVSNHRHMLRVRGRVKTR